MRVRALTRWVLGLASAARNPLSVIPLLLFRKWAWRTQFRVGRLILSGRRSDLVAISEIAVEGEYGFLRQLSFPRDAVILDLGANIGCFAALMFSIRSDVEVHSAEPSPDTCALLLHNRQRHPELRWHVHPVALGAVDGTVTFGNEGPSTARRVTAGGGIPVAAESFDGFVLRVASGRPIFLCKMDIEGAEVPIFAKGTAVLNHISHFIIEVHGPPENASMVKKALAHTYPHVETIESRGSSKPMIHAWQDAPSIPT